MRALSSICLTLSLLSLAFAQDEIPPEIVDAVKADIARRGLPDAADQTFVEQRFTRAGGKSVSPAGEELVVLRGVKELRGGGFVFIGLVSGDYWSLARSGAVGPIMNGPYRWQVESAPAPTVEIEWPADLAADERGRLLDELATDVEPERRRQIVQAVLVSPRSAGLVEEYLGSLTTDEDEAAALRVASMRRKLRREVRQLVQLKLAGEVGGGFYDGQFAEFARYGAVGHSVLLRIVRDADEEEEVRSYAAQALGDVGDEGTVTRLNDLLKSQGRRRPGGLTEMIIYTLAKLGDHSHIEPIIERTKASIMSSPDTASNYFRLAQIYVRMGDRPAALQQYKAFLERKPSRGEAGLTHYNLACTYATLGRIDEAFTHLEKAIELDGVDFDWMQKDGDLDRLHDDPRWKELLGKREKKEPRRIF